MGYYSYAKGMLLLVSISKIYLNTLAKYYSIWLDFHEL